MESRATFHRSRFSLFFLSFFFLSVFLFPDSIKVAETNGLSRPQVVFAGSSEKIVDVKYEKCPVLGKLVVEDVSVVYEGKLYRFCSPACLETFYENPKITIAKIKDPEELQLTITNFEGKLPIKCLVTGAPALKRVFQIRGDSITFYCCSDCREKDRKTDITKTPGKAEEKPR